MFIYQRWHSVRLMLPLTSLMWSCFCFHRTSSDQVGMLFGNSREWLPQAATPSRVWRCHHSSGPCLRQGGWGQARNEVQVNGWISLPLQGFGVLQIIFTDYGWESHSNAQFCHKAVKLDTPVCKMHLCIYLTEEDNSKILSLLTVWCLCWCVIIKF